MANGNPVFYKPTVKVENEIIRQVEGIQSHGREFCIRIELKRIPRNLRLIIETLTEIGTSDYTVIVEGGVGTGFLVYVCVLPWTYFGTHWQR